jgi:hypothetical protein
MKLSLGYLKVSDMKVNLAVMFAEKAKTSDLILSTANRMYRAMSSFRRGNFKGVAENLGLTPKTVHKTWLEYKYGWTPLLYEVVGAAELMAQRVVPRAPRFSVSSRISDPKEWTQVIPGLNRMGFDTNLETMRYYAKQEKFCRVKLWCEISNPHLSSLQQMGVTNPALVAWELVPYSFVFDWFISVGNYLQAITALHGITVRKAMVSFTKTVVGNSVETFPGYSGTFSIYSPWTISRFVNIRSYSRSPITVNPLDLYPPVDFSLPNWQKMMTGLALLRSNSRSFGNIRV